MIIGFISNKLTLRGTEINLFDYADFNEKILGNKSIIITRPYDYVINFSPRDLSQEAYTKFNNRFTMEYYINNDDINNIVKSNNIDVLFIEKAGSPNDGLVFNCCKTIIHAVFTTNEPHGDLYAPISDALNKICGTNYPVLPYMVNVFDTSDNLREELNIPTNAIVFGSYSGADEYTNEDVKRAVSNIVLDDKYNNIYFIYLNIDKFGPESPRLKFIPGTADMRFKRMFINTCDAMLYARNGGETFGLACGEFSICDKPVIASPGLHSNAHEVILGDDMIKFHNYDEVYDIITSWPKHMKDVSNNGYKEYTPFKIMMNFKKHLDALIPKSVDYYPNSIVFVTAFKDIGRDKWDIIPRTTQTYIETFLNLARNIDYKLVVYVENKMLEHLKTYNLSSNVILLSSSNVNTFYDMYIENERLMINSEEYKNKIPLDRKGAPEHWSAEYNLVNHSKINYIAHTKKLYPMYEYYSWLDFGCIRNTINDVPKHINFNKLHHKISYLALIMPPSERISADNMLKSHDVYLAGSQFITHTSLVETHLELYAKLLETWKTNVICDEDQGAILQLYFENRELFELFPSNEWFSLFRNHLNSNIQINTKQNIDALINLSKFSGNYVEIGVARGAFSKYILENTHLSKLLLIDPYKNFDNTEYVDGMNYYNMEEELRACKENLEKFNNRIEFIRETSDNAVKKIPDNSIDVVYIDGNHAYEYALNDMRNYWPKIRNGGIMFGDDVYEYSDDKNVIKVWDGKSLYESLSFGKYGVHAAIIDFCREHNVKYYIFSNQFMIYKF